MDGLLIGLGFAIIVGVWLYALSESPKGLNVVISFLVAAILIVLGSWVDNWFIEVKLVEHHNVSSLPVDGGQLEFFDPVDILETQYIYPWYITGKTKSDFEVKE